MGIHSFASSRVCEPDRRVGQPGCKFRSFVPVCRNREPARHARIRPSPWCLFADHGLSACSRTMVNGLSPAATFAVRSRVDELDGDVVTNSLCTRSTASHRVVIPCSAQARRISFMALIALCGCMHGTLLTMVIDLRRLTYLKHDLVRAAVPHRHVGRWSAEACLGGACGRAAPLGIGRAMRHRFLPPTDAL